MSLISVFDTSGDSSDNYFCDEQVNNTAAKNMVFVGSTQDCEDPADIWERFEENDELINEFLIGLLS